jgi:hypothetical protein
MNTATSHIFPAGLLLLVACSSQEPPAAALPPQQQQRLDALHTAGRTSPFVLHPVRVLGRPDARVAEALGLVLEARGMSELEPLPVGFEPAADAAWPDIVVAFAAHAQSAPPRADAPGRHHLYAEFLGTPKTGPTEVRFAVVDAAGRLVFDDRQTPADAAFRRTAAKDPDPMGCATLVADRLFTLARWRAAPGEAPGRLAERWRQRSGVPDAAEREAMATRLARVRETLAQVRLVVLPTVHAGEQAGASAARLATALGAELGCQAAVHPTPPPLTVTPDSNEQARLWQLARGLRTALAQNPAEGSHALVADIGLDPTTGRGYVHAVLCTASGEFVLVEHRNDQHPEFQRAAPRTLASAERLLTDWLGQRLR